MAGSLMQWLKKVECKPQTIGLPDPSICSTQEEFVCTRAANDCVDRLDDKLYLFITGKVMNKCG